MGDQKKASRKTKRFSQKLFKERGISCTQEVSQNIVICNAGQATGLKKDDVLHIVKAAAPDVCLLRYIAEKGLSYSFLVFISADDAFKFYVSSHGKIKYSDEGPPLYMTFTDTVPDLTQLCTEPEPPGLRIIDDFITDEEESRLYKHFDWIDIHSKDVLKNRQVRHYGYEFRYGSNDVDLSQPLDVKIPVECHFIFERLTNHINLPGPPDQLTVNKYEPGQGIPLHVDRHSPFSDCILSLSLGGSVLMDWKHATGKYVPVLIRNKSMLIMQGEARYDWQHGIQARATDPLLLTEQRTLDGRLVTVKVLSDEEVPRSTRISLTFRWTRRGPCACGFPALCDVDEETTLASDHVAARLEDLHVHQVYERIASHFSSTRHTRWPRVERFVAKREPGSVLLDLGAGNGKNVLPHAAFLHIGVERSWGLVQECSSNTRGAVDCVRADALATPLLDSCADAVISIAVIHHFSNESRRRRAIAEISRLLRPGGEALITVWARDQARSSYLTRTDRTRPEDTAHTAAGVSLPVHENRTQFRHSDLLVPWKLRSGGETDTLLRYYHVFEEGELETLCGAARGLCVVESFYEQGNWCVVCKKL